MNDDAPRCPNCGRRVSVDASVCGACGFELVTRRSRIRCAHCGSRIAADSTQCPRCGADPRASRFPYARGAARIASIILGVFLVACIGWVIFRAITTNTLSRALGLGPKPAPTQIIQIIYVVATPVPPTPTPLRPAPPTPKILPTPTRRGARAPIPAATPVPILYAAPMLTAPLNATVFQGVNSLIVLQWQPVSPNGLREDEWYNITITFTARDGSQAVRTAWSKETRWNVPNAWWNDASADARAFKWSVVVMRIQGVDPSLSPHNTPVSPASTPRLFFWN